VGSVNDTRGPMGRIYSLYIPFKDEPAKIVTSKSRFR